MVELSLNRIAQRPGGGPGRLRLLPPRSGLGLHSADLAMAMTARPLPTASKVAKTTQNVDFLAPWSRWTCWRETARRTRSHYRNTPETSALSGQARPYAGGLLERAQLPLGGFDQALKTGEAQARSSKPGGPSSRSASMQILGGSKRSWRLWTRRDATSESSRLKRFPFEGATGVSVAMGCADDLLSRIIAAAHFHTCSASASAARTVTEIARLG